MMIPGEDFLAYEGTDAAVQAENRAWNSFYHSGKVEDYIRYAQLRRGEEPGAHSITAGVQHAGKDSGTDH